MMDIRQPREHYICLVLSCLAHKEDTKHVTGTTRDKVCMLSPVHGRAYTSLPTLQERVLYCLHIVSQVSGSFRAISLTLLGRAGFGEVL